MRHVIVMAAALLASAPAFGQGLGLGVGGLGTGPSKGAGTGTNLGKGGTSGKGGTLVQDSPAAVVPDALPDVLGGGPARSKRPLEVLAAAPPAGVDPDYQAALREARERLEKGDAGEAARLVLRLHLLDDEFAKAQRGFLVDDSVALLREAGRAQLAQGRLEDGVQALDAAWLLSGRKADPEHAKALVAYAEKLADADKGAALWTARRAVEADPGSREAASLDAELSANPYKLPGYAGLGLAAVGTVAGIFLLKTAGAAKEELTGSVHSRADADGLIAKQKTTGFLAAVSFSLAGVGYLGGMGLLSAGDPKHSPVSPQPLPALPEAR